MRSTLWLSIVVFISTLVWPSLLDANGLLIAACICLLLISVSTFRMLAVIPLTAIYFTLYAHITLTGSLINIHKSLDFNVFNNDSIGLFVDGQNHTIVVQINSLISDKNQGYFRAKLIAVDGHHLNYRPFVEMRWYNPLKAFQEGQIQQFIGKFKPVNGRANPAGFDRQKWSFSEHLGYQVNIKQHLQVIDDNVSLRGKLYQRVKQATDGLAQQGIILALTFADKSLLSPTLKETIKQLGLSHLFVISGLHIGLLFTAIFAFLYWLVPRMLIALASESYLGRCLGWGSWAICCVGALLSACFYAYLAGFSLPTQRALLMLSVTVLVMLIKRKHGLIDLFTLVLFTVLVYDPLAILSLSLWLSFTAVAVVMLVLWLLVKNKPINESRKQRFLFYLKALFTVQFLIGILMLPMQLLSFSAVNVLSPVFNVIAIPIFSILIIPLMLINAALVFIFPPLANIIYATLDLFILLFFQLMQWGTFSYLLVSTEQAHFVLGGVIIVFLCLFLSLHISLQKGNGQRYIFVFAVGLISLLYYSGLLKEEQEQWLVEVFDVGQGTAVLVRYQGHTLLYDTGPKFGATYSAAKSEIVPYLIAKGIRHLDYLVVSHSDNDHAGGALVISEQFAPKKVLLGEPINTVLKGRDVQICQAGQVFNLSDIEVQVLSPFSLQNNNNNNSCVLKLTKGGVSVLLTGDIEAKQESLLIGHYQQQLNSQLLIAPHHGSKSSSSMAFIEAVNPTYVIFTSGFMNHWGFPAKKVKLRYEKQGVKMVNSGVSGFIRFAIVDEQINIESYREDLAGYWYHRSLPH